jgi:hypothetical protein
LFSTEGAWNRELGAGSETSSIRADGEHGDDGEGRQKRLFFFEMDREDVEKRYFWMEAGMECIDRWMGGEFASCCGVNLAFSVLGF